VSVPLPSNAPRRHLAAAALSLLAGLLLLAPAAMSASDCCDPESPFREGEGYADTAATCENIAYWADRAPKTDERFSLSIKGKLSAVHWTGVIAYIVMCDEAKMEVVCVTYETNDMKAGDVVSFAGGYRRRGEKQIIMDPCLASRE
jgi:hypothetical protein